MPTTTTGPVGSRALAVGGGTVTTAVYPLRRDGSVMWLTAHVTVAGSGPVDVLRLWAENGTSLGSPSGWRVVDQANKQAYLPATVHSRPLCGPSVPLTMSPGDELWISCAFGAVPTSVTTVTIQTQNFGVFDNVPVS